MTIPGHKSYMKDKRYEKGENYLLKQIKKNCPHKHTVAINEQGHAGVYCVDCGKRLEREC